jgi:excisionase family DNA binding protein
MPSTTTSAQSTSFDRPTARKAATMTTTPIDSVRTDADAIREPAPAREPSPRVLLTVEAAADRLSIGRTTMFALLKAGDIVSVRIGHLRRIPATELDAYAERLVAEQSAA